MQILVLSVKQTCNEQFFCLIMRNHRLQRENQDTVARVNHLFIETTKDRTVNEN